MNLSGISASPWGEPLLQDIDLNLQRGEIVGIIGPNGAGKSSLLKVMSGEIVPQDGELTLDDTPLDQWPDRERALRLAVLPQQSTLRFPFSVEQVVLLGRMPHATGQQADLQIVEQALAATDALALRQRPYTALSGGEQQRVQLARVLAQAWPAPEEPGSVVLLDEPTAALDLQHQQWVADNLRDLAARGLGLALVMHDLNLLSAVADRILVLNQGCVVTIGKPEAVYTEALFAEVFNARVTVSLHPTRGNPLVLPA